MDPKENYLSYKIVSYLLPYQFYNGLSQLLPITSIKYKLNSIPKTELFNRIYQFNHTRKIYSNTYNQLKKIHT